MQYTIIDNIKLFYRILRNGLEVEAIDDSHPTLLVLHGGPGIVDHQVEFDAWQIFSSSAQVVFVDQRGCGRSDDGDPDDWNLARCGQDIKMFCESLGISKPIIAGVSWGGYVAMAYATEFPGHPGGLILSNTEAQVDLTAKKEAYKVAIKKLGVDKNTVPYNELGYDIDSIAERVGDIACEYDKNPTNNNFELLVKYCIPLFSKNNFELKPPYRVNMAMRERFITKENLSMDFRASLNKITCPVLQMAGDRDPTHPAICAERTAACFPNARYILFRDAGAPVYQDRGDLFAESVKSFINDLKLSLKKNNNPRVTYSR